MDKPWYEYKEGAARSDVAEAGSSYAERLWREDQTRRDEIERNMKRYNARGLRGLFASAAIDKENVRVNLTKQAISTLVARIGSSRPRPRCLTTGAAYSARQRSKQLQKFLDVLYQVEKVHIVGPQVFRDAALCGTGIMRPYACCASGRVRVERVFPAELMVDQLDALDGDPTMFVRVKFMTRQRLREMALHHTTAEAIKKVPSVQPTELPLSYRALSSDGVTQLSQESHADLVKVFELTKLATFDEDGNMVNGTRLICAGPVLIEHCEYESTEPPYLWFHWCEPLRGFWGDSAASEIRGPEREVNRLLQKIQRSMQLAGQPWVISEEDACTIPKLTDDPGLHVKYKNGRNPPTITTHQPVHPMLMQQAMALKAETFASIGLNELQVAGMKPAGIESGRGLEQLSEEHSMRFRDVSQRYEQLIAVDLASRLVACARELDEELREMGRGGYKVRGRIGKEAAVLTWSESGIAPDDLTITCWPASILPQTPAARSEEIQRMVDSQMITPEEGARLQEIPDLEAETSIVKADCDLLDWQICSILEDGKKDIAPAEEQNLAYALKRGTLALLEATRTGAPMSRCDALRDFLSQVKSLMEEANAQQTPAVAVQPPLAAPSMDPAMMAPPGMPPVVQ